MALNLVKLCVGVDSVEDLESHVFGRLAAQKSAGTVEEQYHTTRMVPKRKDELLDGGSLYWVIKGNVQVRQRLLELRPVTGEDGISRVQLHLEPVFHRTQWQPRRAFQGWRYLKQEDAPADLDSTDESVMALPADLRLELASLGLL